MSDVLQNAQNYHDQLKAELAKVDDFLSFGEALSKRGEPEVCSVLADATAATKAPEPQADKPSPVSANGAAPKKAEAAPAGDKNGHASLFRGKPAPCDSGTKTGAALERLTSTLARF